MRMGYEFWEEFWKWLLEQDDVDYPEAMQFWLKNKYKEYEELWMSGQVKLPPLKETFDINEMQERLTKLELSYYGHFHETEWMRTSTPLNKNQSSP